MKLSLVRVYPRLISLLEGFASSMKQVSGVKAKVDLDATAPRIDC